MRMFKNDKKIKITELFIARAGHNRPYYVTIKRFTDTEGGNKVFEKIDLNDGYIIANANDREELGLKLNNLLLVDIGYDFKGMQRVYKTYIFLN